MSGANKGVASKKYHYAIFRSFLGGLSNTITKTLVNGLPMYHYVFAKYLGVILLNMCLKGFWSNLSSDFKKMKTHQLNFALLILSAILVTIGSLAFYGSIQNMPVSIVSIVQAGSAMVFSVGLGVIFLREKIKRINYFWMAMILAALCLVIGGTGKVDATMMSGIGLLLLGSLLGAVESTIMAQNLKVFEISTTIFVKMVFSLVGAGILMLNVDEGNWGMFFENLTFGLTLLLIYTVVNALLIKYLQSKSVISLGSSVTSIFNMMTPILSAFLGMLFFKEWFTWSQYIGLGLAIFSLYMIKRNGE